MSARVLHSAAGATLAALISCVGDDSSSIPDGGADATADTVVPSDASDAGDAGPCGAQTGCPAEIEPNNLQLWLSGDVGVDCPAHRVTTWHDRSTHGRNATPAMTVDAGAVLGAECNEDTISNLPVASFTDPTPSPNVFQDEVLQVDLSFLQGSDFTIAIVHKQTAYVLTGGLLIFDLPPIGHCGSSTGVQNTGALELVIDHTDTTGAGEVYHVSHDCPALDAQFPGTASLAPELIEYTFDSVAGMRFFVNANEITSSGMASMTGITQDGGQSSLIGRGSNWMTVNSTVTSVDTRYKGDIAEIVAYNAALTTADRQSLETYLKIKWVLAF